MTHFFKELFGYSHHFNQQLATIFTERTGPFPEQSVKLFNHILNAHQIWNSRIIQDQKPFGVWDLQALNELKEIDHTNYVNSIHILEQPDLNNIIKYTTSRGDSYANSVQDILFHVINHSTYHRGQIAMEFRQNGIEPLTSDYIFYKR
ncbi:MAG: DinB family protein [Chitinophagaceae bacterium]